jgi:hypothetical protein
MRCGRVAMLTSSAIATLISWNQKLEIAIVFL